MRASAPMQPLIALTGPDPAVHVCPRAGSAGCQDVNARTKSGRRRYEGAKKLITAVGRHISDQINWLPGAAGGAGHGHVEQEFPHIPGAGRTALGAEAAMQANIFVLDHDPSGL